MLTVLIIMTLLVGMFIGATGMLGILIHLEKKDEKQAAKDMHPSTRVGPNPFITDGPILS